MKGGKGNSQDNLEKGVRGGGGEMDIVFLPIHTNYALAKRFQSRPS